MQSKLRCNSIRSTAIVSGIVWCRRRSLGFLLARRPGCPRPPLDPRSPSPCSGPVNGQCNALSNITLICCYERGLAARMQA